LAAETTEPGADGVVDYTNEDFAIPGRVYDIVLGP
jgi:hypothetical protein